MPEFYTRYASRPRVGFTTRKPSMTFQEFKDETDITTILRRYNTTGAWTGNPNLPPVKPIFADVTDAKSYHEAQNIIAMASQMFDSQPAEVRSRFNNDPSAMLRFVEDKANWKEAAKLGMLDPEKVKAWEVSLAEKAKENPLAGDGKVTAESGPTVD